MKSQSTLLINGAGLLSAPLSSNEATRIAAIFRVLGEPARLQLLSYIASQPMSEACVCELTQLLDLSQPTISHHLKVMYEVGLLDKERRGNWIYYKVVPAQIEALQHTLSASPKNADEHKAC